MSRSSPYSRKTLLKELIGMRDRCGVWDLRQHIPGIGGSTGVPFLTNEQQAAVEASLKEGFNNWWDSWIDPKLKRLLEKEIPKPAKNQDVT